MQFNYALPLEKYEEPNAIFKYGIFRGHFHEAFFVQGVAFGRRFVHGLIALSEVFPGIGHIAALFEKLIVQKFSKKINTPSQRQQLLVNSFSFSKNPKSAEPTSPSFGSVLGFDEKNHAPIARIMATTESLLSDQSKPIHSATLYGKLACKEDNDKSTVQNLPIYTFNIKDPVKGLTNAEFIEQMKNQDFFQYFTKPIAGDGSPLGSRKPLELISNSWLLLLQNDNDENATSVLSSINACWYGKDIVPKQKINNYISDWRQWKS